LSCLFFLFLSAIVLSKDKHTRQWPKEKGQTDKTMAERERTNRQDNGRKRKEKQTRQWNVLSLSAIVLSVFPFSFGHCLVCFSFLFRPLSCLFFLSLSAIVLSVCPLQWPKEKGKTEKTMAERERKNRQYNGRKRKEKQTRQWPKGKGQSDNTMAERKRKNRQDNDLLFRPLSCLFVLSLSAIVLYVCPFSFSHCLDNVGQNTTQKTKEQHEPQYNWA
jgi:hypothetical protein